MKKNRLRNVFLLTPVVLLNSLLLGGCATTPPVVYTPPTTLPATLPLKELPTKGALNKNGNKAGIPSLLPSLVQAVWVAPFIDVDGNYHSGSYVYCVVRQEQWSIVH